MRGALTFDDGKGWHEVREPFKRRTVLARCFHQCYRIVVASEGVGAGEGTNIRESAQDASKTGGDRDHADRGE